MSFQVPCISVNRYDDLISALNFADVKVFLFLHSFWNPPSRSVLPRQLTPLKSISSICVAKAERDVVPVCADEVVAMDPRRNRSYDMLITELVVGDEDGFIRCLRSLQKERAVKSGGCEVYRFQVSVAVASDGQNRTFTVTADAVHRPNEPSFQTPLRQVARNDCYDYALHKALGFELWKPMIDGHPG